MNEPQDPTPRVPDDVSPPPPSVEPAGGVEQGPDLGTLFGGGGGLDVDALFQQASQMQEQMAAAQEEAAATTVEGVAGGGVVRVEVNGAMEFRSITISPEAVDPDDVAMLEDLVLAAVRDAVEQVNELQAGSLGGMDLGGLLGGDG
jgi:DNA-binding YbaB/EbfC family protein